MAVNEDIEITIESEPSQFTELEVIPIYGPTGNGISRIEKTDTSYNVDTYTIYFTNGTTTTFTVTNGVSILDIQKTNTTGLVDTYTISLSDGNTHTFTVTNGAGISNIAKTSTSGLADTYTVTLNNSDSYTFTVTNGKAGTIEIGTVTTGAAGSSASVTNVGTDNEAILDFVIPKGDKGDTGDTGTAATISVGTTTTGEAGTQASVTNSGTSSAAVFNFTIPKGDKGNKGDTGATGNGVTGVALQSWVGLDKTYRMSYTNGSYYDFVVSDGAAGEAEWGGISGVLSNQHDLQDALHSSKGYIESGTTYTDSILYNDVYTYNHSTFDLSKFTVAGTPTITDDGIASVTADGNMTQRVSIPFTFDLTAKKWSIISNFTTGSTVGAGYIIGSWRTNDSINCYHIGGIVFKFTVYVDIDGTRTQVAAGNTSLSNLVQFRTNTKYIQVISRNNDTYTYTIYNASNPSENGTITITSEYDLYTASVLCIYSNASPSSFKSCNLKEVKTIVNDIPIFSGTKTDIDIIKSDNYTEVGTGLTITDEGIVSGFTNTGTRLEANIDFTNMNTFSIEGKFYHSGVSNGGRSQNIFALFDTTLNTNRLYLYNHSGGSANVLWNYPASDSTMSGDTYWFSYTRNAWQTFKFDYDGTNIKLYINGVLRKTSSNVDKTWLQSNFTLLIGNSNLSTVYNSNYTGQIDLSSFKIYVNGDLVYQPCLLIPYNESSTGSKIVDVAYRDRVIDVYEQYGSANYYTIDETNQNATLPMGEIYGLIGQRTLRASYRNGINYWEEYSDRTLEQGGSCTSGTTVNLLKPFADTNYVLTVPYSAKTTTSFTPSASGDWIAKGLGE